MADTGRDFYAVLGVDSDASTEEIRAAYRERAKETHPDQSDAPDAAERFHRVKRAEEVLTDPAERSRYDRLGHEQYAAGRAGTHPGTGSTTGRAGTTGADKTGSGGPGPHEGDTGTGTRTGPGPGSGTRAQGRSARHGGNGVGRSGGARAGRHGSTGTAGGSATGAGATGDADGAETFGGGLGRGLRFFDRQQLRIDTSEAVFGFAAFFLYPIFLASSVLPTFPLPVNLLLACCLFCTVGYLLATPEVGAIVFGAWTLFGPAVFLFTDQPLLSWPAFFLVATTAIPFGLSLVVREVLRAPGRR